MGIESQPTEDAPEKISSQETIETMGDDWESVAKHMDATLAKGGPWSTIHGEPEEPKE